MTDVNSFLEGWGDESPEIKNMVQTICSALADVPGLEYAYRGRPGISHSLRIGPGSCADRSFFGMIDVIDDEPEARWLSICLYADLVEDPKDLADPIPGGLDGEDAMCFDLDEDSEDNVPYILGVLLAAAQKARDAFKKI